MSDGFYIALFVLLCVPFAIAALKGRVGASIFGFVAFVILVRFPIINLLALIFLGLAIYRAVSLAQPYSLWAKWFYDDETVGRAEDRYLRAEAEDEEVEDEAQGDEELILESRLDQPDEAREPPKS